MKKQVVIIPGGMTFNTYKEYIFSLKSREVGKEKFQTHRTWRNSIDGQLGHGYEVLLPKMPNSNNSVYVEWKIWFEKMTPFVRDDVILVGHSLGGIFLAKYLEENKFKRKIKALILVAAPFDDCTKESLGKFILPKSLKKLAVQVPKIYLVYSKDDEVVPFSEMAKYQNALANSVSIVFKSRGHFSQDKFPELVRLIKKI